MSDKGGSHSTNAVEDDPLIGASVGGYLVKSRLGSGGLGIVYEGEHPTLGTRVAIKVLRHEVAETPEVVQRLMAEARTVNAVGHRGLVEVFSHGVMPDGRHCLIMEYLDGESLELVLRTAGQRLPLAEALMILEETLSALSAVHRAGVIHRGLKPSNVFLCRQRDGSRAVKLLDFGIAKLGALSGAGSRAHMLMGVPSYLAPEQASGSHATPALDLYSVGVMAFEMLTGRLPFEADSVMELLMKHANEAPQAPSKLVATLGPEIDAVVLRLLAKRPTDRPASADDARAYITNVQNSLGALPQTAKRRITLEEGIDVKLIAPPNASPSIPAPSATPAPAPAMVAKPENEITAEMTSHPAPPKPPTLMLIGFVALILALVVGLIATANNPTQPGAVTPDAPTASAQLSARLEQLERRLTEAQGAGVDVSTVKREVKEVREALQRAPLSTQDHERLGAEVDRLEERSGY